MTNSDFGIPSPAAVGLLADRIEGNTGLCFSGTKRRDLHVALGRMSRSMGFDNEAACLHWLLYERWDKAKEDVCAHHLTIGETYFFREPRAFELLCDYARAKLKDAGGAARPLRIWSAGCSTGEEPYSIAMALRQALPEMAEHQVSILATDINTHHLQLAGDGVYRQWSFRNTDAAMKRRYFSDAGAGQYRIDDDIRKLVRFSELNLAAPAYPSLANGTYAMDIIFCRNVLMYFSRQQAGKVIERFRDCLVEGGWLIVSPCEASSELFAGFSPACFPDAIYFRKTARAASLPTMQCRLADSNVSSEGEPTRREPPAHTVPSMRRNRQVPAIGRQDTRGPTDGAPSAPLCHARALIAMESGDYHDAMQNLKSAIYLDSNFILARYTMGVLLTEQNRHGEAARQFGVTVELLAALKDDDVVPGSDGLHAGYLLQSVHAYLRRRTA